MATQIRTRVRKLERSRKIFRFILCLLCIYLFFFFTSVFWFFPFSVKTPSYIFTQCPNDIPFINYHSVTRDIPLWNMSTHVTKNKSYPYRERPRVTTKRHWINKLEISILQNNVHALSFFQVYQYTIFHLIIHFYVNIIHNTYHL